MFNCPFFRCWSRSEASRRSDTLKDWQSELQQNVQPVSETTVISEGWGTTATDNDSEVNPLTQLEIESTDNVMAESSDKVPPTIDTMMLTAPSPGAEDLVGALNYAKPGRASKFQRRSKNIAKTAQRYSSFKPMIGSVVSRNRDTTVISDWGDCYEDSGDFRISHYETANISRVYGSGWSDGPLSLGTSYPKSGSSLGLKPSSPVKRMPVVKGMVLAMVVTKQGQKFRLLNLNVTLQEVVNTFLKAEAGASLPVSFTLSTDTRPKLLPADKMALTLKENLEGYIDELKQGISFFTGPVNGKLSYKMSVCQLEYMEKLFQISSNRQSTRMLRSTDL